MHSLSPKHLFEKINDVIHGMNAMKSSSGKDPLIVNEGSMTRSRAKRVKEVMWLLVQATVDEILINANKSTSFMLNSNEEG